MSLLLKMSHDWNEDRIITLIELVRDYPNIWNPENDSYKNKNKRIDAFNNIAKALGISREEIERKWKVIQTQFRRECGKSVTKSGQGTNELYISHWFGYKHLMFLKDRNMPRPTRDTQVEVQTLENAQNADSESETSTMDDSSSTLQYMEPSHETVEQFITPRKKQFVKRLKPSDPHVDYVESQESRDTVRQMVPPGNKKSGKRSNHSDPQVDEAFQAIKALTGNRTKTDSFDVYGEHVANKLRTYNAFTRADVEHKINCILHDADMQMLYQLQGQFNQNTTNFTPLNVSTASSSSYSSPPPSPYSTVSIQKPVIHHDSQVDSFINSVIESQNTEQNYTEI